MKNPAFTITKRSRSWNPEILARQFRRPAWGVLAGALLGFGSTSISAEPVASTLVATPATGVAPGDTPGGTNAPIVPALNRRPTTRAVDLATTPSAAVVVPRSRLLETPGSTALSALSTRPASPVLESRMNRETLEESLRRAAERFTPEQAGSAFNYVRRKSTLRGFWDLVDPLAPLPPSEGTATDALTGLPNPSAPPRALRSDATHEATLRVF